MQLTNRPVPRSHTAHGTRLTFTMPCVHFHIAIPASSAQCSQLAEVTAELIADGVHVDEIAMKILLQSKDPEHVILISDGMAATGMPDGKYKLGGIEVTVSGGICRNAEGRLAGSTLTLDRALRNIVNLGTPLENAVRMLTLNPATLLGIEFKKGALRTGADADIVLLNEGLEIASVYARGTAVQ